MTPQDYQPPGFKEAESDTFVFEKEPVKLSMGEVVTPYHSLKLGMATERHRLEQVNGCPPVLVYSTTDGQEMEEEMKSRHLKPELFLLWFLCPSGGGARQRDGEVGPDGRGTPVTGQKHTNYQERAQREVKCVVDV